MSKPLPDAIDPPPGRRIVQISSAANGGGVVLFILCDDGSVWSASAFHEPKWHLVVRPPAYE